MAIKIIYPTANELKKHGVSPSKFSAQLKKVYDGLALPGRKPREFDWQCISAILASETSYMLVAVNVERGTVVGSGEIHFYPTGTGWEATIQNVAVLEPYRESDVGTRLAQALIDKANRENCDHIDLTSKEARRAGHGLWQKLGFRRRDTVCFRLTLSEAHTT